MITILHSGYAAEFGGADYTDRIWSHKWTLYNPWTSPDGVTVDNYFITAAMWGMTGTSLARVGCIAHEVMSVLFSCARLACLCLCACAASCVCEVVRARRTACACVHHPVCVSSN